MSFYIIFAKNIIDSGLITDKILVKKVVHYDDYTSSR